MNERQAPITDPPADAASDAAPPDPGKPPAQDMREMRASSPYTLWE